jgi:FkbM family methyltransferase
MTFKTRLAFQLLRSAGYRLTDVWDSWRLVFADAEPDDDHALRRRINRYLLFRQLGLLVKSKSVDLVVDVGAFQGEFAKGLRRVGYDGQVVCVEPNPDRHRELERAAISHRLHLCRNSVGSVPGSALLMVPQDASFASTIPFSPVAQDIFGTLVSPMREFQVQQLPLSIIIRDFQRTTGANCSSIMLKSDTQGLDRMVVQSLGEFLDITRVILVEVPVIELYEGVGSLSEHNEFYESLGFIAAGAYPVSWTSAGEIVEFDFVYIKRISQSSVRCSG